MKLTFIILIFSLISCSKEVEQPQCKHLVQILVEGKDTTITDWQPRIEYCGKQLIEQQKLYDTNFILICGNYWRYGWR